MARRPRDPVPEPEQHAAPEPHVTPEPVVASAPEQTVASIPEAPPRRRWSGWSFAAGAGLVAAVVLLAGGTSWVVARAAAATPEVAATAVPGAAMKGTMQKAGARAVRGSIAAIDGSTWTVTSRAGETVTVTVGGATQYGRPGSPSAASDFRAGESVVVVGTRENGKVVAKRIVAVPTPAPSATPTT